jgi:hypothetical protein
MFFKRKEKIKYYYLTKAWYDNSSGGFCATSLFIDSNKAVEWKNNSFRKGAKAVCIEFYEMFSDKKVQELKYQGSETMDLTEWTEHMERTEIELTEAQKAGLNHFKPLK